MLRILTMVTGGRKNDALAGPTVWVPGPYYRPYYHWERVGDVEHKRGAVGPVVLVKRVRPWHRMVGSAVAYELFSDEWGRGQTIPKEWAPYAVAFPRVIYRDPVFKTVYSVWLCKLDGLWRLRWLAVKQPVDRPVRVAVLNML